MINICKNCKKKFEYNRKRTFCCDGCHKQNISDPINIRKASEKRKITSIKRYGVDNPSKSQIIKEKTKNVCLKKYGVKSPTLVKKIHDKQKKTCMERYGVKNPQQNKTIQKKQVETLIKNYGVSVPLKNEKIKNKVIKTCMERYDVHNPMQNKVIRERMRNTCTQKYGTEYPMRCDAIKNKVIKKLLDNQYHNILSHNKKYEEIEMLFDRKEYIGVVSSQKKYPFQCKKCNTSFEDTLICGKTPKCPECHPKKISYMKREVYDFIREMLPKEIQIIENDRTMLHPKELDIYIPTKKLAIEFNGLYWHTEIHGKKYKNYHINKTRECEKHGIKLIHITDEEWADKEEIVKNRLRNILGVSENKIYARSCKIREIDSSVSDNFLEQYHLQGKSNAPIRLGAFQNNNLIAVMIFGSLRVALGHKRHKDKTYEIYRFCTANLNVVGIASKLIKYFIEKYLPTRIISYADIRWCGLNSFYSKIGFTKIRETGPNYWYVDSRYMHCYNRFGFRKSELSKKLPGFDLSLTEWQNMKNNGFDRYWDCGNLLYEMVIE